MKLLLAFVFLLTGVSQAQSLQGLTLQKSAGSNTVDLEWVGEAGKHYYLQCSPDLKTWSYMGVVDSGDGSVISYGFPVYPTPLNFRVVISLNSPSFDSDGDGLSDGDETAVFETDPFDDDSDKDGVFDGDEVAAGTDPLNENSGPFYVLEVSYPDQEPMKYFLSKQFELLQEDLDPNKSWHIGLDYIENATTVDVTLKSFSQVKNETTFTLLNVKDTEVEGSDQYTVESVELIIPSGGIDSQTESSDNDPLPDFGGYQGRWTLLPVDLDIVHPATGELEEEKEDNHQDSGIVAVKVDDDTPVTQMQLHSLYAIDGLTYTLEFDQSDKYRIWKDEAMTEAVTSKQTEFEPNQEHTIYFEGLKVSTSNAGEEIKQLFTFGDEEIEGDSVRFTVAEAEFEVWLNLFIPVQWGDLPPGHPIHWESTGGNDLGVQYVEKIFGGDDRSFHELPFENPALDVNGEGTVGGNSSSRTHQQITVIPYPYLDADGIKGDTKEQAIGVSHNYKKSTSVPSPNDDYSDSNRLTDPPDISSSGTGDTDDMNIEVKWAFPELIPNSVDIKFGSSADNPIVQPSFAIDWDFSLHISCTNRVNPIFVLHGQHDGFPAYEMYVRDSDGKNGAPEGTKVYQFDPIPLGRGPESLLDGKDDEDVSEDNIHGDIE